MGLSHSYSRWDSGIAVIAWLCSTSAVSAWLCSTSLLETGMDHIRSLPTPESPVDFELLSGLLLQAELVLNSADPDLALGSVLELAEEDVVD